MVSYSKMFTVEGSFPFPTDMLRYDQCWPYREGEDSIELAEAMSGTTDRILRKRDPEHKPRKRRITFMSHKLSAPTEGRWESFGWSVVGDIEKRRIG